MFKKIKLWWLRVLAEHYYLAYKVEMSSWPACGLQLANYLKSAKAQKYADRFNKVWKKIQKLDSAAPNVKLSDKGEGE